MKVSKSVALPLLLVILLGAMGLSYAWWTETLQIDGNVNTGELSMKFTYWYGCEKIDDHTLRMTVTNAYPGKSWWIKFTIENVGTIPAKFEKAEIIVEEDDKGLMQYVEAGLVYAKIGRDDEWYYRGYILHTWKPLTQLDDAFNAHTSLLAYVFKPGYRLEVTSNGEEYEEGSMSFKIDPNAPNDIEGATLKFTLKFTFKQWNS